VHILSGRMTVTPDGRAPLGIGAGDVAVFPRLARHVADPREDPQTVRALVTLH